ncbi:MAG: LamB/YcsF family protein [Gammaproteobacteria bacterium]
MNRPSPPCEVIDLNADLGEGCEADERLLPWVSSANIACGLHAGDPVLAARTIDLAQAQGVALGAHPGWPDREGFGRARQSHPPHETRAIVSYQIGALNALVHAAGGRLHHVKPHGALYHQAARDLRYAVPLVEAIVGIDRELWLYAPDPSVLSVIARERGIRVAAEGFADRRYEADGTLTPRSRPDALIADPEEALRQVTGIVREGCVRGHGGERIPCLAQTIGLHGDGSGAVKLARRLREGLLKAGITIQAPG